MHTSSRPFEAARATRDTRATYNPSTVTQEMETE